MDLPFIVKKNKKSFHVKRQLVVFVSGCVLAFVFLLRSAFYKYDSCKGYSDDSKLVRAGDMKWQGGDKLFAYYILTEACLPDYIEKRALGDSKRLDVYVLSFMAECLLNKHSHIHYYYENNISWSGARNFLFFEVQKLNKRYQYHIFMDDDVKLFYTEHMAEYSQKTSKERGTSVFLDSYLKDPEGYKQAVEEVRDGITAWRAFEDDLLKQSPAVSTVNYLRLDGFESHVTQEYYWNKMCRPQRKMPWITTTYYMDQFFIAFHEEALPILLPYVETYDELNWSISAFLLLFRARAILPRQNVCNFRIAGFNQLHRFYPRSKIPDDVLLQYINKEAPELNYLIESKYMSYKEFRKWKKYEEVFFADRSVCLGPIKFPPSRHYRIRDN